MPDELLEKAAREVRERYEAQEIEPLEVRATLKGRDSAMVTVVLDDSGEERQTIISRQEVS